jgi:hypothetical protein
LRTWDEKTKNISYLDNTNIKLYKLELDNIIVIFKIYRVFLLDWDTLDGIVVQSEEDENKRYNCGIKQGKDSCTYDIYLFVYNQRNFSRIKYGQIVPSEEVLLNQTTYITRITFCKQWGLMDQRQRDLCRNIIMEICRTVNPDGLMKKGKGN